MKPKLTLKRTFQPKDDHAENQRLCQAHFHFCESQVQNFKHLISKKEKELVIPTAQLQRSQEVYLPVSAKPSRSGIC